MIYHDIKEILNNSKCEWCYGQGIIESIASSWECTVCEGNGFDKFHHNTFNSPGAVIKRLCKVLNDLSRP